MATFLSYPRRQHHERNSFYCRTLLHHGIGRQDHAHILNVSCQIQPVCSLCGSSDRAGTGHWVERYCGPDNKSASPRRHDPESVRVNLHPHGRSHILGKAVRFFFDIKARRYAYLHMIYTVLIILWPFSPVYLFYLDFILYRCVSRSGIHVSGRKTPGQDSNCQFF